MANILQVGSTPVTPDTSIQHGRVTPDLSVKNPVNPNAVNRADGQDTGQAGSSTAEGHFSGVDFEGNYAAFIRTLSETGNLPKEMETVLFGDAAIALSQNKGEIGESIKELFSALEMESPEDLKAFLQNHWICPCRNIF